MKTMHQIFTAVLKVHMKQHGVFSPEELANELHLAVRDTLTRLISNHGHYVTESTKHQGESKIWNSREDANAIAMATFLDVPLDTFINT